MFFSQYTEHCLMTCDLIHIKISLINSYFVPLKERDSSPKPNETKRFSNQSHCCPELCEFPMQWNIYCWPTYFTGSSSSIHKHQEAPVVPLGHVYTTYQEVGFLNRRPQRARIQCHLKSHSPSEQDFPLIKLQQSH